MDFFEVVKKRRSVRSYTGEAIPVADLVKIIDTGRLAPSGFNRQGWCFIAITEKSMIEKIASLTREWAASSGAMIAVVMDPELPFLVHDASAATENILLAATALGYGSCWLEGTTRRVDREIKLLLSIPEFMQLQTIITLGVPVDWPEGKKKPLEKVIRWEKFST
jgi:nitroreductase